MLTKRRQPAILSDTDDTLMKVIRRVNLDAFWSREPSTVKSHYRLVVKGIKLSASVGLDPPYPAMGPLSSRDVYGYGVATQMLLYSLEPGRYDSYIQFDTARRLRSAFSSLWDASVDGQERMSTGQPRTLPSVRAGIDIPEACPTESLFFTRFVLGMRKRMGQDYRPQRAITSDIMVELVRILEAQYEATSGAQRDHYTAVLALIHLLFCGSLRGNEGFMLEVKGLSSHLEHGNNSSSNGFILAPLLGRFKGETGERWHLVVLANVTSSGLRPRKWLERLLKVRARHGHCKGPALCDFSGKPFTSADLEPTVIEALQLIQMTRPDLIPADVVVSEEYGLFRSFRRGATTSAGNAKVPADIIDAINRWRTVENARGSRPNLQMRDYYTEIRHAIPKLIRFSAAL